MVWYRPSTWFSTGRALVSLEKAGYRIERKPAAFSGEYCYRVLSSSGQHIGDVQAYNANDLPTFYSDLKNPDKQAREIVSGFGIHVV